jgi:hypothetical protein
VTFAMPKLSPDGLWWGSGQHRHSALSPDGWFQWDGESWINSSTGAPPEVLEVMDPWSLAPNRGQHLSTRQLWKLILHEEVSLLLRPLVYDPLDFGLGCLAAPFYPAAVFLWAAFWVVLSPFVLLMCIVERLARLTVAEGPLQRTYEKGKWWIWVESDAYQVPAGIAQGMSDSEPYRLYLTRLNPVVINYERMRRPSDDSPKMQVGER